MIIRYILGRAGSGKLYTCINEILEMENNGSYTSGIFIVPEQFTLQAEQQFMQKKESRVIFNTQILSFKRLAFRMFSKIGFNNKTPLEDIGKIMILRKIIFNLAKEKKLLYFSESCYSNIGILEKINKTIQEFLEHDIDAERFEQLFTNLDYKKNKITILKLKDLKQIYIEFKKILQNSYISNEEILNILSKQLLKTNLIESDTIIWIYGFNGFTAQELNVISALAKRVKQINICLTYNSNNINIKNINHYDPFYNVKITLKKIYENIIKKQNITLAPPLFLEHNFRHAKNEELYYLESQYFSYKITEFDKEPKNIEVFSAQNKYLEIERIAQKINYLIKNEQYKYKEIAVIFADESYKESVSFIFNKYNLPYFLDYKKQITQHPLVELILSIFDINIYNNQYEDIFRFLKTGFFEDKIEEINILENYVLAYGIKGDKWQEEFVYGFKKDDYDKEKINEIRLFVLDCISKFKFDKNKKYKVLEISTKIFDLLIYLKIDETLEKWGNMQYQNFYKEITGNTTYLNVHVQVFNNISKIIQKIVDVLENEEIYIEEYFKILKAGLEKEMIGILPKTQDQILIGDFERTRILETKVLFCVGMNDGVIPCYKENTDFISDEEKDILLSNGIELNQTSNIKFVTDNLQIYSIIFKATEKLIFSYAISNLDGIAKKPSSIINKVLKIFPKTKLSNIDTLIFEKENIYSPNAMFDNLFIMYKNLNNQSIEFDIFKDIFSWFLNNESYLEKLNIIKKGLKKLNTTENDLIEQNLIEQIYLDKKLLASVSKLEEFRRCPFSYFLKYNLNAKERAIQEFDYLKLGTAYHYIIEKFSNDILKKDDLKSITRGDVLRSIEDAIENLKEDEDIKSILKNNPKYNYYLNRIKKITFMSSFAMLEQFKTESFKTEGVEVGFGDLSNIGNLFDYAKIDLDNSYEMLLNGKIDRVDAFYEEDKSYLKIIDYKSSENDIDPVQVYNGLKLQLLTYLSILLKLKDTEAFPFGAVYFEIKEHIFKKYQDDILKELQKEYKQKGFVYDKQEILEKMGKSSGIKKIDEEQFINLLKLVDIWIKTIGNDLIKGNIKVHPFKYKDKTGCDYCKYKSICKLDILQNKEKFNKLKDYDSDIIWEKIKEKIDSDLKK